MQCPFQTIFCVALVSVEHCLLNHQICACVVESKWNSSFVTGVQTVLELLAFDCVDFETGREGRMFSCDQRYRVRNVILTQMVTRRGSSLDAFAN